VAWSRSRKSGRYVTVALRANSTDPIHTLPLRLSYDPGAMDIVQVQEGTFFKRKGSQSLFASNVDVSSAKIIISAGSSGTEGASGEEDIALITLKARAAKGVATLQVLAASSLLADGRPLSAPLPEPFRVIITE